MTKLLSVAIALWALSFATSAVADEIELYWNSAEIGFVEKANEAGDLLHGLAVYVRGSRMVTEDDFNLILPEFCESKLDDLLKFVMQIEGAPEVTFLSFSVEFYGPKIGESQTYIAGKETIDLVDGECSP